MPSKANFRLSITTKINAILIILATIFLPCSYVTYHLLRATSPVEAATETKLLLDPGPRHKCYHYRDLAYNDSYISRAPECEAVQGYSGCPTWRYSSYGSNKNHSDLLVNKDNGTLIDVALVNNARYANDEPSEVSLDYYYPGCSIQKLNNLTQFNLLDFDEWIFEYDVIIRADRSPPSCSNTTSNITLERRRQPRRYLTTEFIYQYPDPTCLSTNIISTTTASQTTCQPLESTIRITHFDTAALSSNTSHSRSHLLGESPSKSITHPDSHLSSNHLNNESTPKTHHISLDFRLLYQQHQHLSLFPTTPSNNLSSSFSNTTNTTTTRKTEEPPWLNAHMIRIVSGALGTNSVVEVGNVSAVLRKGDGKGASDTADNKRGKRSISGGEKEKGSGNEADNVTHPRRSEISGRGIRTGSSGEKEMVGSESAAKPAVLRVRKRFNA